MAENHSMKTFLIVWIGQIISMVGSWLTSFGLAVWVLKETGSVTQFAMISLAAILPAVFVSPVAGVYVDRWDRRKTMMVADLCAGLGTLAVAMGGYDGHRGWVYYLAVHPERRNSGAGKQMMHDLERRLIELGCPKINLMVREGNEDVVNFYKQIGYQQDPVVVMSKRLIKDRGSYTVAFERAAIVSRKTSFVGVRFSSLINESVASTASSDLASIL